MLKFEPPELEAEFRHTLTKLTSDLTVYLEGEEIEHNFNSEEFEDLTLTTATRVSISLLREIEEGLTVGHLMEFAGEVADPKTSFDGLAYHSSVRTVLRVTSLDMRSIYFAEKLGEESNLGAEVATEVSGHPVLVGLRSNSLHYGAIIVLRDYFYDKYNPPVTNDDVFVEVTHPHGADKATAMAVIQAYLFELHSTLGLEYFEAPRPTDVDMEYPEREEISDLTHRAQSLRPLLLGPGLPAVLQEFNRGYGPANWDAALLCYVKCIEYVAATVVREKQYEDLRKRLLSREALNPGADYLDGLLTLFEENRVLTRDTEALRLAVERCCDPVPMALHAPKFLRLLTSVSAKSNDQERKAALSELAAALSASRNQLAHAKANYKVTGKECPSDQIDGLVACAKMAAEQCIRWYAARSPELRKGSR